MRSTSSSNTRHQFLLKIDEDHVMIVRSFHSIAIVRVSDAAVVSSMKRRFKFLHHHDMGRNSVISVIAIPPTLASASDDGRGNANFGIMCLSRAGYYRGDLGLCPVPLGLRLPRVDFIGRCPIENVKVPDQQYLVDFALLARFPHCKTKENVDTFWCLSDDLQAVVASPFIWNMKFLDYIEHPERPLPLNIPIAEIVKLVVRFSFFFQIFVRFFFRICFRLGAWQFWCSPI
jgi:hypothetical protein